MTEYIDQFGESRGLGCIPKDPEIAVGAAFEDNFAVWDLATIKEVVREKENVHDYLKRTGFWDVFTAKANQRSTSACNGWLTANAYTLARYLGGMTDGTVYSGAFNYSLMNHGSDNGSALVDGFHTASENGFVPVELCPWNKIYRKDTKQFDGIAATNKAADPYPVKTILGYLTGLAKGGMGGCAIQVGSRTEQADARGIAGVTRGIGNHAVVSIDLRMLPDGTLYFPTYLDWGNRHGTDGLVNLVEQHLSETISRHQHWILPIGQGGSLT